MKVTKVFISSIIILLSICSCKVSPNTNPLGSEESETGLSNQQAGNTEDVEPNNNNNNQTEQNEEIINPVIDYKAGDIALSKIKIGNIEYERTEEIYVTGKNGLVINSEERNNNFAGALCKNIKIMVFCKEAMIQEALDAGATYAGADEYIEKVKDGWLDFDICIAAPDMMKDVGRLGMVLGRVGLMPNPKNGTVTTDVGDAVTQILKTTKDKYELSPYAIGKYEVTQELYKAVMTDETIIIDSTEYILDAEPFYCTETGNYSLMEGEVQKYRPAEGVTWFDVIYFCNVLTKKTMGENEMVYTISDIVIDEDNHITFADVIADISKKGYRLPLETEWENAARGGDQNKEEWSYYFSGAPTAEGVENTNMKNTGLDTVGWYTTNNNGNGSHEVGKKNPNTLNILDMSGNVAEWCYNKHYSSASYNAVRGGSWSESACFANVCYRHYSEPKKRAATVGIRLVRTVE